MKDKENTINIFWTGGLDSTFRLIQCLTTTTCMIQPHYIVRHEDSTGIEIDTMIQIRRNIVRKFPEVRSRFLPTIYFNEDLIQKDNVIDAQIDELRKIGHVKEQYQIMSYYCKAQRLDKIEVALEGTGNKDYDEEKYFYRNSEPFRSFSYPTIELTKKEMFDQAKMNNWDEILLMTSFCRRPIKKIMPCGICGPCVDAVAQGVGFRLNKKAYIKAQLENPFRKYWRRNYLKQNDNWFFSFIKKKLEGKL
jgi:7-cyano-7-deazaguanine synthase in queuosine biosynthesis